MSPFPSNRPRRATAEAARHAIAVTAAENWLAELRNTIPRMKISIDPEVKLYSKVSELRELLREVKKT